MSSDAHGYRNSNCMTDYGHLSGICAVSAVSPIFGPPTAASSTGSGLSNADEEVSNSLRSPLADDRPPPPSKAADTRPLPFDHLHL